MKKKYAPPPERDPPPAMFVGDEAPPPAAPVPAKAEEQLEEVQAALPDDLRAVTEGTNMERWVFLAPALLLVLIAGLGAAQASPGDAAPHAAVAALCALLGWAAHRYLVKHRKEFRLTDEGIVLEVRHRAGNPRVTRIPWAEMRVYTAVADADEAFLYVVDDRGGTVTLSDVPPRASAREFIRRFMEQAERHGIAARPPSETAPTFPERENKEEGVLATHGPGCLAWLMGWATITEVGDALGVSFGLTLLAAIGLPGIALHLWNTLYDSGVALRDRTSRKLMVRLRRWLREVFGIDVI